MERAIRKQITEKFADERAKVANNRADLAALEYKEQEEFDRYHVEHTIWLNLALLFSALAVLAVMTRVALDNRGNRPPPKLVLHY